jgi:hypothetical protein
MSLVKRTIRKVLAGAGYALVRKTERVLPPDFDAATRTIIETVQFQTLTPPERIAALVDAVRYVDRFEIPGALVECGVWRGGSTMAAILAHQQDAPKELREVYLYDTFEGMPPPSGVDVAALTGQSATDVLALGDREKSTVWALAALETVKSNIESTGYPRDKVTYASGMVEETIPGTVPNRIAILRLDTDWYQSTHHELEHLAPLVSPGGILIVDDYGHWEGARKAVDEWIAASDRPILLHRVDYSARIAVLP